MAFELVDQHRIASGAGVARVPTLPTGVSRAVAAALALAVTSGFVWLALTRLIGRIEPRRENDVNVLQFVTVSEPAPLPPQPTRAAAKPQPPVVHEPTPVQVVKAPTPAPEWAMSRIRVPVAAPSAPAMPIPAPAVSQGQSAAVGRSGGGSTGYDPYAGATPMRGGPPPPMIQPAAMTAAVDRAMLEGVRSAIRARFPSARGSAMMTVQVGTDGRGIAAEAIQSDLAPVALAALAEALTRPARYPVTGKPYRLRLPVFIF